MVRDDGGVTSTASWTATRSPPVAVGLGGAGDAAVQAGEDGGIAATGEFRPFDDVGDHADVRVLGFVPGNERTLLLVADVDREGDGHAGEDDGVVEGDQSQVGHGVVR